MRFNKFLAHACNISKEGEKILNFLMPKCLTMQVHKGLKAGLHAF
jgi:hypothetical protein